MPITVPCVKCKTKFSVPSKFAGQTVKCKNCGCMLRLPSPEKIQAKKLAPTGKSAPAPQKSAAPNEFDFAGAALTEAGSTGPAVGSPSAAAAGLSPEPTVLSCSHCQGLLYYDPNFANQTVACPHCGNHLIMPDL